QDSLAARAVLARLGATPAERLARAPTAREKDYLRTLDVLYANVGTKAGRDSAYARAAAQLAKEYPDDVDAHLFHALSLLSLFPRTDSTYLRAGSIAMQVVRAHPQHPLEIPMHDAELVGGGQSVGDLPRDLDRAARLE